MAKKCIYIKADKTKCKANSQKESKYCYFHDPEKEKERQAARARGGKNTGTLLKTAAMVGELVETAQAVQGGNGSGKVEIETLNDLQLFAERQIQYIEDNKSYSKLSISDRVEMRKWADFLLKLKVVQGLGAESRIRELEDQARKQLMNIN